MLVRQLLVFLLPFFVLCNEKRAYFRNDYDYNVTADYWFKFHPAPVSWHEARRKCNYEGTVLASPLDHNILSVLQSTLDDNEVKTAYVGLHSTFSKSDWHSIEGIPITKMKLDKYIHFSQDGECAVFHSQKIVNVNCSEEYPFVCYKNSSDVTEMNVCGTTDPEYVLDRRTDSCYKLHRQGVSWTRGFEICAAEGGYLAIIDNETEVQVIIEIFEKNPNITIKSHYQDIANIGIIDWDKNREWYTVHGESIKEYPKWSKGEPNNAGNIEYCAGILRNGQINDVPCHTALAFICEKDRRSLV